MNHFHFAGGRPFVCLRPVVLGLCSSRALLWRAAFHIAILTAATALGGGHSPSEDARCNTGVSGAHKGLGGLLRHLNNNAQDLHCRALNEE